MFECPMCGAGVPLYLKDKHECNPARYVDHQVRLARHEIIAFDAEVAEFLRTREGQFALFYAERTRPAA
jgi:hypothetical protein